MFAIATFDLSPLTSDSDGDIVVPFHNRAMREMHPRRAVITLDEFRVRYDTPQVRNRFFGINDEHGALAALGLAMQWVDGTNAELEFVQVLVRPDKRRLGLARELLARSVEIAVQGGRTLITADTVDTVPSGDAFAVAIGADIGMREHINVVAVADIDILMLERWRDEGPDRAPTYELLSWTDGYPSEHDAQIARLFVMADEDMPFEDLDFEPNAETAESVRERLERTAGTTNLVTSVSRHRRSGDIVGFSELAIMRTGDPVLYTTLTVVDRDHRGHALGKWIKADAILRAVERFPEATHIQTENAFSNAPMLGINDAIGFKPEHTLVSYQASTDGVRAYLERDRSQSR